ncbi:hypothetical protein E4Z66_05195 [Aliishimia ponticola]|uniref:histidine kinase n=1 Tax=Aliishimia ponticola TaxID=2499833 RepID=A0A4S4NH08_9RHOB|nr:ATP-binding protein [Aliishimia ponticola]THH38954.1 hypothetical protein E4Z66_05195 [Aliishimia ponticola]
MPPPNRLIVPPSSDISTGAPTGAAQDADDTLHSTAYDLTGMKKFHRLDRREIQVRLGLLGIMALAVGVWLEQPVFLIHFAIYFVANLAVAWIMRHAPFETSRAGFMTYGLVASLPMSLIVLSTLTLWASDEPFLQVLAMMLLCSNLFNMLTVRAVAPILINWDVLWAMLGVICLVAMEAMTHGLSMRVLVFALCCAGMMLYFVNCAGVIVRFRRRLDAARLSEQERSKMEAIGRLTGGVSHDFNNLLTVILGSIELSRLTKEDAEREALLAEAEHAGRRAARLTAQLLSFSRQSVLTPRDVDIANEMRKLRSFLLRILPPSIWVEVVPPPEGLGNVRLDPGKLETVLVNLALNARDAMPDGGTLELSARDIGIQRSEQVEGLHLAPGQYVVMQMRDTGEGIAPATLPLVTEPFFTTKTVGEGSGLGLSMVKGFAEQSGGALEIKSRLGEGTIVRLYIPVVEQSAST